VPEPPKQPPRDPRLIADQTIRAAAKKIGNKCSTGRPTIVGVKIVADLAKNSVEPTLTGMQSTAATCVVQALRGVKPLKKAATGSISLTLNVVVGAGR